MPGGLEDDWMRNEPMRGHFALHDTPTPPWRMPRAHCNKYPRRRSAAPAPVAHPTSIYASDIPYSQHIHVSGTELHGIFQRRNRGVDVYYYPRSGVRRLSQCERKAENQQGASASFAMARLRLEQSEANRDQEEQKERKRKQDRRSSTEGQTRKESHVAICWIIKREENRRQYSVTILAERNRIER
ncbi:hypothetical protein B0H13DRAFT_1885980 [Mycena leptocephala]|nr:hypothetical protein B0H13DRAFT_1885980 [Mycena leptocephala]